MSKAKVGGCLSWLLFTASFINAADYAGAIKIRNSATNATIGYLDSSLNATGQYAVTPTYANRLMVSFSDATAPFLISIDTYPVAGYPYLGSINGVASGPDLGAGSSNHVAIGATTSTAPGVGPAVGDNSYTAATTLAETIQSSIWSASGSNVLSAQWLNTDLSSPSIYYRLTADNILVMTSDVAAFETAFGPTTGVTLTYEGTAASHWLGQTSSSWNAHNWASDAAGTATVDIVMAESDVVFSALAAVAGAKNTTLDADFTIKSLTMEDSSNVTISGGGNYTLTVDGPTGIVHNGTGDLKINSALTLTTTSTIAVNNTGEVQVAGVINSTTGLTKEGTGTLVVSGANNYTGGTTVTDGVMALEGTGTIGVGDLTVNGGAFEFRDSTSATTKTITNYSTVKFVEHSTAASAIVNNSGLSSHTIFSAPNAGDSVTAADSTITNSGDGSYVQFDALNGGISTAGNATILNSGFASHALFYQNSTAGDAKITNEFAGSYTEFFNNANAGTANIENKGLNSYTKFQDTTSAGTSLITNSGENSLVRFNGSSTSGAATITNTGINAGVYFIDTSSGGTATLVNNSTTGFFDFSQLTSTGTTVGSLAGNGLVYLGSKTVTVGGLNTSTEFSGVIADGGLAGGVGGSINKVGTGAFTLSGINTYTGPTVVRQGTLFINGSTAAESNVSVRGGAILGGTGTAFGAVTVRNGGTLAPGVNSTGTLTVGSLNLNRSSNLAFELGGEGSTNNDRIDVIGDVRLDGLFSVTDAGGFEYGSYRIINYGGELEGKGLTATSLPKGVNPGNLFLDMETEGQVNLVHADAGGYQYWDGTTNRASGQVNGGSGVWSVNDTNWTNSMGNVNGAWYGQKAVFAGVAGTVTLGSDIPFEEIIFDTHGYRIEAPNGFGLYSKGDARLTVHRGKATIAAPVAVEGTLYKTGGGLLDLQAPATANATIVTRGKLAVNSVLVSPHVGVNHNATLMGNGLIIGNVFNNGTVAPGNSIGTLSIDGNYSQKRNGTLQIEVGPTSNDLLLVSGTANLAGTLDILSVAYKPVYGEQIPFLVAKNIKGGFNKILMPQPDLYRGRFLNEEGMGVLLVAPTSYTLVAQNANQRSVARALDHWIGVEKGDIGEVTLALDKLSAPQYPQAFEAMSPALYQAALSTGIELSQSQGQMIHQQLSARRLGQRAMSDSGQTSAPYTNTIDSGGKNGGGKSAKDVAPVMSNSYETHDFRWSTWVQGSGMFSEGGMSLAPGEDFESGTFMVGADYAVTENVGVGMFASYGEGWGDYKNGGKINLERVLFGGTATVDIGNFYMNGAVGVGKVDYSIRRPIQFAGMNRKARSNPDGTEFFTMLGTGYDFRKGGWTFGPQASIQYSKIAMDDFRERGANSLDLAMRDADAQSLRSYLGARIAYTVKVTDNVAVIPELRAFWQHEFLDGETMNSNLDGGNGPGFAYTGEEQEKDSMYLGAGLGVQVGENFYTNLYYNVDLGRDDPNHNVSVSATLKY